MHLIYSKRFKRMKYLTGMLCITFLLAGCSYIPSLTDNGMEDTWTDSGYVTIGSGLTVQNTDDRLTLLNNIDALSANGLYYASWSMGNSEPYVNSDGDTVDLYDAQLYLLFGEFHNDEEAQNAMGQWLAGGKANYDILAEEEMICNGQNYSLITYNCVSEDNPYDRGISAFCTHNNNAVCIELTCQKDFQEDLKVILQHFLDSCTYSDK